MNNQIILSALESQLVIKIKKGDNYIINNIIIKFLLYILSFLTCIIFEIKKCSLHLYK